MATADLKVSLTDADLEKIADMVAERLAKLMPPVKPNLNLDDTNFQARWAPPNYLQVHVPPNYSPGLAEPYLTC